jgi:hypothetical protein
MIGTKWRGLRVVCGTLWVQVAQEREPYRLRSIIRDRRDGNSWAQMSKDMSWVGFALLRDLGP